MKDDSHQDSVAWPSAKPPARKSFLRRWCRWAVLTTTVWAAGYFALPWAFELPSALFQPLPPSLVVKDRHGVPLRQLLENDRFRAAPVTLGEIPADFINCTLAAEDGRFWSHGGVDYLALGRAVKDRIAAGRFVSGASTIPQQLIKNSAPPVARNFTTKIREAMAARHLEMTWSKEQILERYLNLIEYGNLCRGCAAASEFYFQKPLADLSLAECALLASLPQAPSRLNPLKNMAAAQKRRDWVLDRLAELHPEQADSAMRAKIEPAVMQPLPDVFAAGHVVDMGLRLSQKSGLPSGTQNLTTTIDSQLQAKAENILKSELQRLQDREAHQGAVVVIDNKSGEILALAGSANYHQAQWNAALAPRSAGSTLKPFTYALALERGRNPGTILEDVPTEYLGSSGLISMVNYDRKHRGPVTLRESLGNSYNIPAVRLLNELGGPALLFESLINAGFTTLGSTADRYGLGLTIGNAEVSLLELTNAYAALARLGEWKSARLLMDAPEEKARDICSPETAWMLADILSDNNARSASFGAESQLRMPFRCACKTGTSSDFRDNWCVGFTPEFTVGVWIGNFDNHPMKGVSGVTGAGPVFHALFLDLAQMRTPTWFAKPQMVNEATMDSRTGHLVTDVQSVPSIFQRREYFNQLAPPARVTPKDYDSNGRVILNDHPFASWMQSRENLRQNQFVLSSQVHPSVEPPVILSPLANATYVLDPDRRDEGKILTLRSTLGPNARWESDTLEIDPAKLQAELVPGKHQFRLTDSTTGLSSSVSVVVVSR